MGRSRLGILFTTLVLLGSVPAGGRAHEDSLRTYRLGEMVVSAARTARERVPLRTSVVTRAGLLEGNGRTLADALRLMPGLAVREYGGGGGIQTLSFRGMSAEQTLVLIDGVPANNLQTGVIDLRMLPLANVSSVEVVRGGISALHGSNAVGGMVNVRTDDPAAGSSLRIGGSAGSFGASAASISARFSAGMFMVAAGAARDRGTGRYAVRSAAEDGTREGVRENSDYRSDHAFARAEWESREAGGKASLMFSATRFDRGSPGPLVTLSSQGDGRQSDGAVLLLGSYERPLGQLSVFTLTGGVQRADEHYLDETGPFRGDNNYRTVVSSVSPVLRYENGGRWRVTTGMDMDLASADGNALRETARRSHFGWFAAAEIRSDSLAASSGVVSLVPALRWEAYSTGAPVWNPQLGLQARFVFDGWGLAGRTSAGRSFRVPTMNELYYAGGGGFGNPALEPELAVAAEASVTFTLDIAGRMEWDLTGYSIATRDRIVWQPASSAFVWSPVNIANTRSRGFELEARWEDLSGTAELAGSYAHVDARNTTGSPEANAAYGKQLPSVPLETASFSLQLRLPVSRGAFRRLLVRVADQFLGERFTTEDNTTSLPGTHVLGGNVGVVLDLFGGTAIVKYEVDNLNDQDVQGMPGYPLPLRRHAISFSFERRYEKEE